MEKTTKMLAGFCTWVRKAQFLGVWGKVMLLISRPSGRDSVSVRARGAVGRRGKLGPGGRTVWVTLRRVTVPLSYLLPTDPTTPEVCFFQCQFPHTEAHILNVSIQE